MDSQNKNQSLGQGGAQGADSDQSIGNQGDSSFGASEQDAGGGMTVAPTQYAGSQGRDQDRMQQPGDRQQGGEQQARLHRGGMQGGEHQQGGMQQDSQNEKSMPQGDEQRKGDSTER